MDWGWVARCGAFGSRVVLGVTGFGGMEESDGCGT